MLEQLERKTTLFWKKELTEVAVRYQNVENIFKICKDNSVAGFDSSISFFGKY